MKFRASFVMAYSRERGHRLCIDLQSTIETFEPSFYRIPGGISEFEFILSELIKSRDRSREIVKALSDAAKDLDHRHEIGDIDIDEVFRSRLANFVLTN